MATTKKKGSRAVMLERRSDVAQLLKNTTDEQLGEVVREYIQESDHMGWDGFDPRDRTAIYKFLADLAIYQANRI